MKKYLLILMAVLTALCMALAGCSETASLPEVSMDTEGADTDMDKYKSVIVEYIRDLNYGTAMLSNLINAEFTLWGELVVEGSSVDKGQLLAHGLEELEKAMGANEESLKTNNGELKAKLELIRGINNEETLAKELFEAVEDYFETYSVLYDMAFKLEGEYEEFGNNYNDQVYLVVACQDKCDLLLS